MGNDGVINLVSWVFVLWPLFVQTGDLREDDGSPLRHRHEWPYRIAHSMTQVDASITKPNTSEGCGQAISRASPDRSQEYPRDVQHLAPCFVITVISDNTREIFHCGFKGP